MDENQQQTILRAIAVSSLNIYPQELQNAFGILEELRTYSNRMAICMTWLHQEQHIITLDDKPLDITIPTKLYVLEIIQQFLKQGHYNNCNEQERLTLRQAILTSARQLSPLGISSPEIKILGNKLASVLAGLMVRDFPQRWTTFIPDLFQRAGGIWYNANANGGEVVNQMGVRICLECFKLVVEDCTDGDFNSKISTTRRNDILIGLNEVSDDFLPSFYQLLEQYTIQLKQASETLHQMRLYLLDNQKTLQQMTHEESQQYQYQLSIETESSRLLADALVTLEKFCRSMPLDWLIPSDNNSSSKSNNKKQQQYDFMTAFLHLLHIPTNQIQVLAMSCLEFLILRGKITAEQWFALITELPNHIAESNRIAQAEAEKEVILQAVSSATLPTTPPTPPFATISSTIEEIMAQTTQLNDNHPLIRQLEFYKVTSRVLAHVLSSYIAHITLHKDLMYANGKNNNNNRHERFQIFLRLVVDVLHHPSGRIASEQVNMWITLLRDPQISKCNLLQPLSETILTCYMDHIIRMNWDNIIYDGNNNNPQKIHLIEASWDDEDEYDAWLGELRSKTSLLFRFFGTTDPQTSARVINSRIQILLRNYGNGEPLNNLDPTNGQLTPKSDAVMQLEGVFQPLDAILSGIPTWAFQNNNVTQQQQHQQQPNDVQRNLIRKNTQESVSEAARAIVSWNPSYLWLKFRRATLMDALKHYWKYDPSTLLQGIESLLGYLREPDYWNSNNGNNDLNGSSTGGKMSDETIGLKKKSGVTLIAVSKKVPHHLVPWLSQLSQATRELLSSSSDYTILAPTRMHLYEFLSCIATAIQDPEQRKVFIAEVLADAVSTIEAPEVVESISSVPAFLSSLGITGATTESVRDPANVKRVQSFYVRFFTAINQLLSVGKHCNEAARKRFLDGTSNNHLNINNGDNSTININNFPDEGPVSIHELSRNDPFAHIWPRILPTLLRVLDVTLRLWHPEHQAILLQNNVQRYAYAISDDEAFASKNNDGKSGGVFGEGGTAGSVITGTDRRDRNLVPKWSGWFNELRNTCFQMLGLLAGSRVLYAPELSEFYPQLLAVVVDPMNLKAMEHRHLIHFIKHFLEILTISCPATMYPTHYGQFLAPVIEHMQYRLERTWLPVMGGHVGGAPAAEPKALFSHTCSAAAADAARGGDEWFDSYYARAGLFVGDLDTVTAETALEKGRVDITRTFCDFIQSALALKGDWALVLANHAKEEQANRRNDSSKLSQGPKTRPNLQGGPINADGTPRGENQAALDARKMLRIQRLCHFLLLEDKRIAGSLTVTMIQCLSYPDQYTCRRVTRICHRILETVAWVPEYAHLLGDRMFLQVVKNIVREPKWMVGIEWDAINVMRDIYNRLVLGQTLLPGGQGPGMQQNTTPVVGNPNVTVYEQAKTVDNPLLGGGILVTPSDYPRKVLQALPDVTVAMIEGLEKSMKEKPAAKNQKDKIRDLLRKAADKLQESDQIHHLGRGGGAAAGMFERVVEEESLLHNPKRQVTVVPDLPEKLVTKSMVEKKANKGNPKQQAQEQAACNLAVFRL